MTLAFLAVIAAALTSLALMIVARPQEPRRLPVRVRDDRDPRRPR